MKTDEAAKLLHAYLDGELDPAKTLELEADLAQNAELRASCERMKEMSSAIRAGADYHAAPAALGARLRAAVPATPDEAPWRARWRSAMRPALSFAAVVLITAAATFAWLRPSEDERLAQEVFAGHVRATLAGRIADVASSDQHTVKPWLSARLNFSPPVQDFAAQGFELVGGRLDYVEGRMVAVLAYKRRLHRVDVYVWPAASDAPERTSTRDGFNMERFARGGMSYWIVSDVSRGDVEDLARLLASAAQ